MMRWSDTANGAWVTLEIRVQVQFQRIGILFSVRARLRRTLERLESQRVVSLELQCRDNWVTEDVFMQTTARNTMNWLVIGW